MIIMEGRQACHLCGLASVSGTASASSPHGQRDTPKPKGEFFAQSFEQQSPVPPSAPNYRKPDC